MIFYKNIIDVIHDTANNSVNNYKYMHTTYNNKEKRK